jgi:hypothetical protein
MFDRFTLAAKRAVVRAREIAADHDHGALDPIHLLLGILDHRPSDVLRLLEMLDIDVAGLRVAATQRMTLKSADASLDYIPFSPAGRAALAESELEATRSGEHAIHEVHLLIGIAREADPEVSSLFSAYGIWIAAIRNALHGGVLSPLEPDDIPKARLEPLATALPLPSGSAIRPVLDAAAREAAKCGDHTVDDDHLGIALLRMRDEGVRCLLRAFGVDAEAVADTVAKAIRSGDTPNSAAPVATERVVRMLAVAEDSAASGGRAAVQPVDVLVGLLRARTSITAGRLSRAGISAASAASAVAGDRAVSGASSSATAEDQPIRDDARTAIDRAREIARRDGRAVTGLEELLVGLASEHGLAEMWSQYSVRPSRIGDALRAVMPAADAPATGPPPLSRRVAEVVTWVGTIGGSREPGAVELLVGALRHPESTVGWIFGHLDVDLLNLLDDLERQTGTSDLADPGMVPRLPVRYDSGRFADLTQEAIWQAYRIAARHGHEEIDVSHLIAGMWLDDPTWGASRMERFEVSKEAALAGVPAAAGAAADPIRFSVNATASIEAAISRADELGISRAGTDVLLAGIARTQGGAGVLRELGVRPVDCEFGTLAEVIERLGPATPVVNRVFEHASYLAAAVGGRAFDSAPLLSALLLLPPQRHARVTVLLDHLDLSPRELFQEAFSDYEFDSWVFEKAESAADREHVYGDAEALQIADAARRATARTGDTTVDTAHLLLAMIDIREDPEALEERYRDDTGFAEFFAESGVSDDIAVTAAIAARSRVGDEDRWGSADFGIASSIRGPAPLPSERYDVTPSSRLTRISARARRRIARVHTPTGAEVNSFWQSHLVRRWTVTYGLARFSAVIAAVLTVNTIAAGTSWWVLFGVVLGLWGVERMPVARIAIRTFFLGSSLAVFLLAGAAWIWVPVTIAVALRTMSSRAQLEWRRRDIGDPRYDQWRQNFDTMAAWISLPKRGRGVR